ncbi:MAG TPA: efflux RND transporter periplasmic adaptor subunit [Terriglobales bacterium]|jgi:multidrug efflux system membrane fusion protein|nr:efflux RND transporter periplasmic adaptor subunit [Terriglobales bacterium]
MTWPSNLKPHAWNAALLSLLFIFIASLAACSGKKQEQQKPAAMAVPVTVAVAQQKDVPIQLNAIGTVEAYTTVGIKTQISGEITTVNFKEGQDVNKGQLLFTIDRRPMEADLRRAEATLVKDQATAANDRAQARRYAELLKQGVVAPQQAEQMETAANASDALVKADQAAVQNARVQLQYAQVYAPISGRTGNLMVQLGNVVKANPDNPIVTINQVTPTYVTFTIPEQFLSEVKRYMAGRKLTVSAAIPNDPVPATGTLTFIDNAVDKQTGTIKLKGTFANADRRLWPGQFVNVTLTLATQPNAITVPTQAVQTGQQGQFVFVIKNNTAELRPVNVTRTVGDQSVVASGVQPGETVVTDGQLRLVAGTKVDVRTTGPGATPGSQNAQQPQAAEKSQQARKQD